MSKKKSEKKAGAKAPAKGHKKSKRPVHILPPSLCFQVNLPAVVGGLCGEEGCDHHAHIKDRRVFIDSDEEHGHGDYHTLVDIAGVENVHAGERQAMAFIEAKDGSLRFKKDPEIRYFPSIESFGILVLGIVYDRDSTE